ncbi:MAG: S41 family peptidase [Patescibacteria group bacterium]|nr:S41 family peptidase [Patescibacteria group bacterium]
MNKGLKKFIKFLVIVVIIGLIYTGGYLVGHKNVELEKGYIPKITNLNLGAPKDIDFSLFWDAWNTVKDRYVSSSDTQKMTYGAISGMVSSLGDPYSLFLTPEEAKNFSEDLKGTFDGIGAELEAKNGQLTIVAPLDKSPAMEAGLRAQDVISKIDNQSVSEMTFQEAINKIRGSKGTEVTLSVIRQGWDEAKEFKIKRDTIKVDSVKWEQKGNITYIKIRQFGDDTTGLLQKAADFAIKNNSQAVIIDLRNNPGGYVTSAQDLASLFLDNKVVVKEKQKDNSVQELKTTLIPRLKDKKLTVLINGGSASASEIFAGAIQDYQRGILVGEKSFGKGSVQSLVSLKDGSEVRITIAKWLTPNNRAIDKEGIKPDIEVKLTEDDQNNNRDPQLDRAIEEANK